jgi:hypothetical protein
VPLKQQQIKYYNNFGQFIKKYEDIEAESKNPLQKKVESIKMASGDDKLALVNELGALTENLTNPFIHVRHWITMEILSLGCLVAEIKQKDLCTSRKEKAIKLLYKDNEKNLKLAQGKFVAEGGLFKS